MMKTKCIIFVLLIFSGCNLIANELLTVYAQFINKKSVACFDLLFIKNDYRDKSRSLADLQSIVYEKTVPVVEKRIFAMPFPESKDVLRSYRHMKKGDIFLMGIVPYPDKLHFGKEMVLSGINKRKLFLIKRIRFIKKADYFRTRNGDYRGGSKNVVVGKRSWLFHGHKSFIRHYQNSNPWPNEILLKNVGNLNKINRFLKKKGIGFLLVSAPAKFSIYREYFPYRILKLKGKQNRNSQLFSYLKNKTKLDTLELHSSLKRYKDKSLKLFNYPYLYSRLDHHWNSYGAYVAYREIVSYMKENWIKDLEIKGLSFFKKCEDRIEDNAFSQRSSLPEVTEKLPFYGIKGEETIKKTGYRLLVIHDSFGFYLKPFFSGTFGRVKYVYANRGYILSDDVLDEFKPDVVVIIQLETLLDRLNSYKVKQKKEAGSMETSPKNQGSDFWQTKM